MTNERLIRIKFIGLGIVNAWFYSSEMAADIMPTWPRWPVLIAVVVSTIWLLAHEVFFSRAVE